jgi:hypothetical protein
VEVKMGPLEFVIIRFPKNQFTGQMLDEVNSLSAKGILRIIDLALVTKNESGEVQLREFEASEMNLVDLDDNETRWFTQDDLDEISDELPNDSSAAMLLFEHAWAARLGGLVRDVGGTVVVDSRISSDMAEQIFTEAHAG